MSRFFILFAVLLCGFGSVHASDNLLRNGDFSRGTSNWKGDRKAVTEGDSKYLVVDANPKKVQVFQQEKINIKGVKGLRLTFKYRTSEDYDGRGLIVRIVRPTGGSTFYTVKMDATPEWKNYRISYENSRSLEEITVLVEVLTGTGSVMFDDFVMRAD